MTIMVLAIASLPGSQSFGCVTKSQCTTSYFRDACSTGSEITDRFHLQSGYIYLGCGTRRDGDVGDAAEARGAHVIMVDRKLGRPALMDLTCDAAVARLACIAASQRCKGLLVSLPCGAWSALRFDQSIENPPPVLHLSTVLR